MCAGTECLSQTQANTNMLKINIKNKLLIGFTIIFSAIISILIISLFQLHKLSENINTIAYDEAPKIRSIYTINNNIKDITQGLRNIIITDDINIMKREADKFSGISQEISSAAKALEKAESSANGKTILKEMANHGLKIELLHKKCLEYALSNDKHEAKSILFSKIEPAEKEYLLRVKAMEVFLSNRFNETAKNAISIYKFSSLLIIGVGVVSILMGCMVVFLVVINIIRPLRSCMQAADNIATGDLTITINRRATDEVGLFMMALGKMVENLKNIVSQLVSTSARLSVCAGQLADTSGKILADNEEIACQLNILASASTEMAATSSEISASCLMAADNAHQATNSAKEGVTVIKTNIDIMARIVERVHMASTTVEQLGARSDQIGTIVGTIEDIADQTNLLALNAAIEAARAGEQGRGFAVVADEVRALAERTTTATREIGEMIKAIQQETRTAVNSMKDGSTEVERGTEGVNKSRRALDTILDEINSVTTQINQIATAATEQTATAQEITNNIQRISMSSQDRMQNVRTTKDSAHLLTDHAENLKSLVRQFRLP